MNQLQVAVAQIGARRHYSVPAALNRAGMLHQFQTDWCANAGPVRLLKRLVPERIRPGPLRGLFGRVVPDVAGQSIVCHPRLTLSRALQPRFASPARQYRQYFRTNAAFGRLVARYGFGQADAVYAFNAAAVEIFRAAKRNGLRTILDQTMAPWAQVEALLTEEREHWPGWDLDMPTERDWRPLADREAEEWELADLVVCGSEFVAQKLAETGGPAERCRVVPHGFDGEVGPDAKQFDGRRRLRVLFVGTVELRKGIPYLLEAARLVGSKTAEFRVVGPIRTSDQSIRELRSKLELLGPVLRSRVNEQYAWADVLVLPTLAEGSANVCYEAMAHGLPVVTTANAGSVVRDGMDGWIVPVRCAPAIAERLERLTSKCDLLTRMSSSARQRAREFSTARYEQTLVSILRSLSPPGMEVFPTPISQFLATGKQAVSTGGSRIT